MRRRCAICLILMLLLATAACERKISPSRQIIALPDVSASIEPEAQESAFQAIENIASTLRRGDSLVVIPITGDAGNQSQGRILRLALSERREAYDQDVRRAASNVRRSLEETKAAVMRDPGTQTDILGALRLAAEEMQLAGQGRKTTVLVLSDLIQDDSQFDFKSDPALKNEALATSLASASAKRSGLSLQGVSIFLGLLRSKDLGHLSPRRRLAIEAFWLRFLRESGANPVLAEDGPGLISTFLASEARAGTTTSLTTGAQQMRIAKDCDVLLRGSLPDPRRGSMAAHSWTPHSAIARFVTAAPGTILEMSCKTS